VWQALERVDNAECSGSFQTPSCRRSCERGGQLPHPGGPGTFETEMRSFHRKHYRWLRYAPRKKHLRGTWLHTRLGERLFAPALWLPSQHEVAAGLALGLFIGFTPTMGAQILLTAAAAYALRVNIPAALAGTFVSNPFTAPLIYPLEYHLGVWLVGVPEPSELEGYVGAMRSFARHAKPLWAGSLLMGAAAAALAYGLVVLLWREAAHLQCRGGAERMVSPPDLQKRMPGDADYTVEGVSDDRAD
jgi:uncharacterized protein (DUF2062 family)